MKTRSLTTFNIIEQLAALLLVAIFYVAIRCGSFRIALLISRALKAVAFPVRMFFSGGDLQNGFDAGRLVIERVSRNFPARVSCLVTVLALQALLRFRNIEGTIELGINRSGNLKEAHAWLAVDGLTSERDVSGYARFSPV